MFFYKFYHVKKRLIKIEEFKEKYAPCSTCLLKFKICCALIALCAAKKTSQKAQTEKLLRFDGTRLFKSKN